MIQGRSSLVYRIKDSNTFVSKNLKGGYKTHPIHVDINLVNDDVLDLDAFKNLHAENKEAEFILEDGQYICGSEIEKMSKSLQNVVNPDDLIERYGSDTFRLYEMFLGPLEQYKPWNTNGIEGVFKFIKRLWRLFYDDQENWIVSDQDPSEEELKILHKTLKKVEEDVERYSFNTAVSTFMICVNELSRLKCNKRAVLTDLIIALSPFAPHVSEELWHELGNKDSIVRVTYPQVKDEYLKVDVYEYPVSVNGKLRAKMSFALDMPHDDIEKQVLASEAIQKWIEGKTPRKVIIVPQKIVNIVV